MGKKADKQYAKVRSSVVKALDKILGKHPGLDLVVIGLLPEKGPSDCPCGTCHREIMQISTVDDMATNTLMKRTLVEAAQAKQMQNVQAQAKQAVKH